MPAHAPPPSFELQEYTESQDHLVLGTPEPRTRSQALIYHFQGRQWWIKVTFLGTLFHLDGSEKPTDPIINRRRRTELEEFVTLINYQALPLLDDTVSELLLEESSGVASPIALQCEAPESVNRLIRIAKNLSYRVREDPSRVTYPLCSEFPSFERFESIELEEKDELSDTVLHVVSKTSGVPYALKVVDRPFYQPDDTDTIRKELENLEFFKGVPGIVQPAGIAVSSNPYMTTRSTDQPPVITGILLEFHSGGCLKQIIKDDRVKEHDWKRWPVQIGTALSHFHAAGMTHMDIKPANVVLDTQGNAILIDIGCIGGITYTWRAPELRKEKSPFELPFDARLLHDSWAYGKLLSEIASHAGKCAFAEALLRLAGRLMDENPSSRMRLSEAVSQLSDYGSLN